MATRRGRSITAARTSHLADHSAYLTIGVEASVDDGLDGAVDVGSFVNDQARFALERQEIALVGVDEALGDDELLTNLERSTVKINQQRETAR